MSEDSEEQFSTGQKIWWAVLVILLSVALIWRRKDILSGASTFFDTVLFLVWIALCLAPLFKVVGLFGVRLRRQVKSLKEKVEVEVGNLRAEMKNSIETQINPNFYLPYPTSDKQNENIENYIENSVDDFLKSKGISKHDLEVNESIDIDNDVLLMFKSRYNVEKEVRRIWRNKFDTDDLQHPASVLKISQKLSDAGIIDSGVAGSIREVYRISSPAIHGEEIDNNQLDLIKDVTPGLVATLRAIE